MTAVRLLAVTVLVPALVAGCPRGPRPGSLPESEILTPLWTQYRAKYLRSGPRPRGELAWKTQVRGAVTSSAAAYDGSIYFASSVLDDKAEAHVHALEPATGAVRWSKRLPAWSWSAPAVSSGRVYMGGHDGLLRCFAARDGREIWSFAAGAAVRSTPLVWEDLVIVGSDDRKVYGVTTLTGEKRWEYETGDKVDSVPVVHRGVLYIGSRDDRVHAINPVSGRRLWSFETAGDVRAMPVLDDERLFLSSLDGWVNALDATTGRPRWSYRVGSPVKAGVAIYGSRLYVLGAHSGLHVLEARTGAVAWTAPIAATTLTGAPAIVDGVLYTTAEDGTVLAHDVVGRRERWRFRTGGGIVASPVVSRGLVYVGALDGFFYALK